MSVESTSSCVSFFSIPRPPWSQPCAQCHRRRIHFESPSGPYTRRRYPRHKRQRLRSSFLRWRARRKFHPKTQKPQVTKARSLCQLGALRVAAVQATTTLTPSAINRYGRLGLSGYGRMWNPSVSISRAKPLTVSSEYSMRSLPTFLRLARMPLGTVMIWHPTDSA